MQRILGAALLLLGAMLGVTSSCVADRPEKCIYTSDCSDHSFCDSQGFCQRECLEHRDCPCGSFCASSCGICLRNDDLGQGPATCFPLRNGLTTADVLGVCRADLATPVEAPSSSVADGGMCSAAPRSLPDCPRSPLAHPPLPSTDAGAPPRSAPPATGAGGGTDSGTPQALPDAGRDSRTPQALPDSGDGDGGS